MLVLISAYIISAFIILISSDGNVRDIDEAGGLSCYLIKLHKEYGSIASFMLKKQMIVSIANAETFKQHNHVFDRPGNNYIL